MRVFIYGTAAGFMVIGHDKLLVVRIDLFAKILDNHFDIANFHDITSCSLHGIHLHELCLLLLIDMIFLFLS